MPIRDLTYKQECSDSGDSSSEKDMDMLLRRFEGLVLRYQAAEEQLAQAELKELDVLQDDNHFRLPRIQMGTRQTRSSPELPVEDLPNRAFSEPFYFIFNPMTTRASPRSSNVSYHVSEIEDIELRALFDSFQDEPCLTSVKRYCVFAVEHHFADDEFLEHIKLFSDIFRDVDTCELAKLVMVINAHYKTINVAFLSKVLESLGIEATFSQKRDILCHIRQKEIPIWELVNNDGVFYKIDLRVSGACAPTQVRGEGYTLVIVEEDARLKVLIGHDYHFNVARKAMQVVFAGNIIFDDSGVVSKIDDASGGFHGFETENPKVKMMRKEHLKVVLTRAGLPADKFVSDFKVQAAPSEQKEALIGSAKLPRRHLGLG